MSLSFIFGGARSGKSAFAEALALQAEMRGREVVYVATAAAGDQEMQQRILHHRQRRPANWQTVEAPLALAAVLERHAPDGPLILIDCLTVWLSNLLFSSATPYPDTGLIEAPPAFFEQRQALLDALTAWRDGPAQIIVISNEVGMGIVPLGAVSRWFVDEAGRLNQAVAGLAHNVAWVAAGLPLWLKGSAPC